MGAGFYNEPGADLIDEANEKDGQGCVEGDGEGHGFVILMLLDLLKGTAR